MMDLHDEREEWISVMTFGVRDVRYYTLLYNIPFPLSLPWKSLVLFVVAGRLMDHGCGDRFWSMRPLG